MTGPACGLSRCAIRCALADGVAVEAAVEVLGAQHVDHSALVLGAHERHDIAHLIGGDNG